MYFYNCQSCAVQLFDAYEQVVWVFVWLSELSRGALESLSFFTGLCAGTFFLVIFNNFVRWCYYFPPWSLKDTKLLQNYFLKESPEKCCIVWDVFCIQWNASVSNQFATNISIHNIVLAQSCSCLNSYVHNCTKQFIKKTSEVTNVAPTFIFSVTSRWIEKVKKSS